MLYDNRNKRKEKEYDSKHNYCNTFNNSQYFGFKEQNDIESLIDPLWDSGHTGIFMEMLSGGNFHGRKRTMGYHTRSVMLVSG